MAPAVNADAIPAGAQDTPMGKRVTEKAEPSEIPKQPEKTGISMDDVEGL